MVAEQNRLSAEYLDMDELERKVQFCSDLTEKKKAIQSEVDAYQTKINQFAKGLLCEADFIELSKDFTLQKERLEAQVLECKKQIAEIDTQIAGVIIVEN